MLTRNAVPVHASILMLNNTPDVQAELTLTATVGSDRPLTTHLPSLEPFSAYKVGFKIAAPAVTEPGKHSDRNRLA